MSASIDLGGIIDRLESHAMTLGLFERVNAHEPKNAPGNGLSYSIWMDRLGPILGRSSIRSTSALLVMNGRVYCSMTREPQDSIDRDIGIATAEIMAAYSASFTLAGLARCIDVLGMSGTPLGASAGYLNQDGKLFRIMVIQIPIIINDVWEQTP